MSVQSATAVSDDPAKVSEAIRCEQLTKRFPAGNILAVDRLDLVVKQGEIMGLLGRNGAGKTTIVGMLTTLVAPSSGKGFVAGIEVAAHPAQVKQLIGVVTQTNNLDRALTVRENLYYHGRFFGMSARESREAAACALAEFNLTERADADVRAISGGLAKRLMVARALLHHPSVLFLDEPTAGLDPQSRAALWQILRKLRSEGQTILLTTHYMEEADEMCDRVAILDHGRIRAMDTPRCLKQAVGVDSIVTLTADGDLDNLSRLLMEKIDGATECKRVDNSLKLHLKGTIGAIPKVVIVAEQAGFSITDLAVSEPTLETVFISLTGKELRD